MQDLFLNVPPPTMGSVRFSYINNKLATGFQDRITRVMKPGSPWLALQPNIHIWEEWSGIWNDKGTPQSTHEANIQYLKNRQASEGNMWHCGVKVLSACCAAARISCSEAITMVTRVCNTQQLQ
jgi:hypothetical protein